MFHSHDIVVERFRWKRCRGLLLSWEEARVDEFIEGRCCYCCSGLSLRRGEFFFHECIKAGPGDEFIVGRGLPGLQTVKRPSVADFQVIKLDICPSNVDTFPDKALQSVTDFCRASTRSVRPAIAVAFSFAWIGARRMQD